MTKLELIKQKAIDAKKLADKATPGPFNTIPAQRNLGRCRAIIRTEAHLEARSDYIAHVDPGKHTADEWTNGIAELFAASRTLIPDQANTILKLCKALDLALYYIEGDATYEAVLEKVNAILEDGG